LGENIGESAPMILAVKISSKSTEVRQVGVCFADATVRELGVSEFVDNETYSNFESLIIQLGVKECIVQADVGGKDLELAKIRTIADNCGCAVTPRPSSDFSSRDIEEDLSRLLRDESAPGRLPQTDLRLAMNASASLIKYLGLMSNSSNFGQYALYQHDLAHYMKLDAAALRALNLMPGPRDGSKTMSLFGLLNHCKTPMGPRLLAQWLKQPLMSVEAIERRQILVEAFVTDTELRQTMQEEHLRSIPDMYRLAKKFQRKKAGLEDVVRAYQASTRLPGMIGTLGAIMDEKYKDPLDAEYTRKFEVYNMILVWANTHITRISTRAFRFSKSWWNQQLILMLLIIMNILSNTSLMKASRSSKGNWIKYGPKCSQNIEALEEIYNLILKRNFS
jgi:DNA mismatch repair protein MSH2